MEYKITRYENYGQGLKKIAEINFDDKVTKDFVKDLEYLGYKRIKCSGIIGLSYEGVTKDKMGKVQITIERVVE